MKKDKGSSIRPSPRRTQCTLSAKTGTYAKQSALSAKTGTCAKRAERAKRKYTDPSPLQQL